MCLRSSAALPLVTCRCPSPHRSSAARPLLACSPLLAALTPLQIVVPSHQTLQALPASVLVDHPILDPELPPRLWPAAALVPLVDHLTKIPSLHQLPAAALAPRVVLLTTLASPGRLPAAVLAPRVVLLTTLASPGRWPAAPLVPRAVLQMLLL